MQKLCSALLVLFMGLQASAQCNDINTAFRAGEVVKYHAYYNWGFIWLNAGEVSFSVDKANSNNQAAYQLKAHGATYSSYDILFKVRDTFETTVDTLHLEPFEFRRITNEGSYHANYHYQFDREQRQIHASIQKEKEAKRDTILPWKACSFDLLTMVYKARNIDYSQYKVDEKIPISMVVDGEIHDIYIRYLGKETIKNRDGRKFNCLKFSPLLVEGTIFKSGEDMTVWVSDDANRIPIIVEAKILIGSVKAVFVDALNTRYPIAAEITK
ncbi:DUF3108 domain-containing protein [Carboxylicivirga sp. M1479]|uniref:DUF3108 domain-containing protein n=1 Tax=Carboxylicivirga sp. M1479 TaxID=2594476 RepID=UPI001177A257|nr:DUF3108 domain-containing protein [Carboxylicivirga sp. M1479]TRX62352.1 DUF3108 domain-containing protein [Carboxylicivirga sp. M1479]